MLAGLFWNSRNQPRSERSAPCVQNSKASDWAITNSISRMSDDLKFLNFGTKTSIGIGWFVVLAARKRHVGLSRQLLRSSIKLART